MAIEIVDGFQIIRNHEGDVLGIELDRLESCIEYANEKGIKKAFIEYSNQGNDIKNVDFFKDQDFFTGLTITATNLDITGIHHLKMLKYLNVFENKQKIDFSAFPLLEEASIDWNDKINNLDKCRKLKKLTLWKYKPKSKSFNELRGINSLVSLKITQSNIESFNGIETLMNLNSLEGYYLQKLSSLNGVESLKNNLKVLILENCKKLVNYEQILQQMSVLEKLILSNCGEMQHLDFVKKMPNLKFFSFVDTNVKDGNLNPLVERELEYVGFDDKRYYSHKMKQINPSFSWKANQ